MFDKVHKQIDKKRNETLSQEYDRIWLEMKAKLFKIEGKVQEHFKALLELKSTNVFDKIFNKEAKNALKKSLVRFLLIDGN